MICENLFLVSLISGEPTDSVVGCELETNLASRSRRPHPHFKSTERKFEWNYFGPDLLMNEPKGGKSGATSGACLWYAWGII